MIKEIESHRSIRQYQSRPVEESVLKAILEAAVRASTVGNMQLYSIVVTRREEMKQALAPLHFNQPAALTAPVLLTFCADVERFSKWCRLRGAEPCYDNFCWFVNAAIDTLLASQNAALEAEAHGLGICYLGTTLYNAGEIADVLKLPTGVIPITTLSVGYPDETPPLTDRLPLEGVVHDECYHDYSDEEIEKIWAEREASEETAKLLQENGLPNLARIFTERRYPASDNKFFSEKFFEEVKKRGFFNR